MLIYNVTIKVDHSIAAEWLQWLREEHIPDMIGTGCFTHATTLRLLDTDDSEGLTYAVQYHAKDRNDCERYINEFAVVLRQKGIDRWGNKFIAFRTLMEVVN